MDMQNGRLNIGATDDDAALLNVGGATANILRAEQTSGSVSRGTWTWLFEDDGTTSDSGCNFYLLSNHPASGGGSPVKIMVDGKSKHALVIKDNANVLIGTDTDNAGRLQVLSTSEQLRLEYDNSNYTSFTVNSGGNLTITPVGNLYVSGASIVLPASEYLNFGGTQGSGGYGIRDNSGTMEYKNSGGSWTAIGSGGSFTSKARAHRSGDQTIPNETWTKVQLDVEDYDVAGEFDNTTNAAATFSDIPDGKDAAVAIETTGGNTKCRAIAYSSGSTDVLIAPVVADIVYLNAGEYLELWVAHHGGAGIEVVGGTWATYMSVHRLS